MIATTRQSRHATRRMRRARSGCVLLLYFRYKLPTRVQCEGYTRVDMSFNGALNVIQTGHSMLHLTPFSEQYLIPLPSFQVKGFFSGHLYPEINGTYFLPSSSGFVSEIQYSGKGFWGGEKNHFEAKVYRRDDANKKPLYLLSGCWRGQWSGRFESR